MARNKKREDNKNNIRQCVLASCPDYNDNRCCADCVDEDCDIKCEFSTEVDKLGCEKVIQ